MITFESNGTLIVKDEDCTTTTGRTTKNLALGRISSLCSARTAEGKVCQKEDVATTGAIGDEFVDLDALDGLSEIEFLYLRSSAVVSLRFYAMPASAQAAAGTFPTGFAGGETLITTIDGTPVTTTFDAADQTAAQCAARINAAMALAGFATPRATVVNGQLLITGVATGVNGSSGLLSFAGTGAATLGLDAGSLTPTPAQGQDVIVSGLIMMEFPTTGSQSPTKIQISGVGSVDVVAAGRT